MIHDVEFLALLAEHLGWRGVVVVIVMAVGVAIYFLCTFTKRLTTKNMLDIKMALGLFSEKLKMCVHD